MTSTRLKIQCFGGTMLILFLYAIYKIQHSPKEHAQRQSDMRYEITMVTPADSGDTLETIDGVGLIPLDAEEMKDNLKLNKNEKRFLTVKVPNFSSKFKNSCWKEYFPKSDEPVVCSQTENLCRSFNETTDWMLRCLPYFYLIGVPKGGTSDLYQRIVEHPHITKTVKQTHFWARERHTACDDTKHSKECRNTLEKFADFYSPQALEILENTTTDEKGQISHELVIGEGSPSTFMFNAGSFTITEDGYSNTTVYTNPYVVSHFQPDAKFILLLRNPVTRTYSSFYHFSNDPAQVTPESFHVLVQEAVKEFNVCLDRFDMDSCIYTRMRNINQTKGTGSIRLFNSIYVPFLMDWHKYIDKKNLLIIRTEDLSSDIGATLRYIYRFLGLPELDDDTLMNIVRLPRRNVRSNKEPMLPKSKVLLREFFKPYNKMLAEYTGEDKFLWDEFN